MSDWHTFYACIQDKFYWNRFHCKETPYSEISIAHVDERGKIRNTKLVAVPMIVPKILHKKYIEFKMAPIISVERK